MSLLIVGTNSYASVADADAFLATSFRASSTWAALTTTQKEQCLVSFWRLLEVQQWAGTKTGLSVLATAALAAAGATYAVNDLLTVVGGTGKAAKIRVLTVSGGAVVTFELADVGGYTVAPTSPASVTGGAGTGATFAVTFGSQTAQWPRSGVVDAYGAAVDANAVPPLIVQGQIQGAFELSQDAGLETKGGEDSNIRAVKAGSVAVDFFAPMLDAARFPAVVEELIRPYLAAGTLIVAASATGFSDCSEFQPPRYGLIRGVP